MEYYGKKKKAKVDICNICGKKGKLTWEHVPSKSCNNNTNYRINKLFTVDKTKLVYESQNGIKYRTICEECNNKKLGANLDKEFLLFYQQTKDFVEAAKSREEVGIININLVDVIKCLFCKFLAMDIEFMRDKVSMAMRNFIFENKISDNLHVYFRLYPYNTIIQTRNHITGQILKNNYSTEGVISLLYYYPFAFILSDQEENIGFVDLMNHIDFSNPVVNLKITPLSAFNRVTGILLPYDWLINVDNGFVVCGKGFVNNIGMKK